MHSGREGGREGISGQTETHEPVAEELSAVMTTDTGRLAAVRGQTKAIFGAVYPRFSPRSLRDSRGHFGSICCWLLAGFCARCVCVVPTGGRQEAFH